MNIRNVLVRSTAVLGVSLVCVMVGEAIAGPTPVLGCSHTQYCYDENGNLTSTTTTGGGICRVGQKCFTEGGCEPTPWAVAECRAAE